MAENLRINYNVLDDAKRDMLELAADIQPLLDKGMFSMLSGSNQGIDLLGHAEIAEAVTYLHTQARDNLTRAHDGLIQLGNSFGSVGDAFQQFDAELAKGWSITGHSLGLDNWKQDKQEWEYYQAHKDECVPGPDGKLPGFCSATDPGAPPVDQNIDTGRGTIHTHLTLDGDNNVIREDTTVTYDGKDYTSTTTYSDDRHTTTTDSTYPDGSSVHNVTHTNPDGSGTMHTSSSDGSWSDYTRGPKDANGNEPDWVRTGGSSVAHVGNTWNKHDDPYDHGHKGP